VLVATYRSDELNRRHLVEELAGVMRGGDGPADLPPPPGALVAVGCAVLAYALVVLRGTVKVPGVIRAPQPAVADAVPAR
jgi:hypothetical protein